MMTDAAIKLNDVPRRWHNAIPPELSATEAYTALRPTARAVLQAICDGCDARPVDAAGSLVGSFRGSGHYARAAGCSVRSFWRHLKQLEAAGLVVTMGIGGPNGFRNQSNSYGVPGRIGALEHHRARRNFQLMLPGLDQVRRPQVVPAGRQATLLPERDLEPVTSDRLSHPSDKLSQGLCQTVTPSSHTPSTDQRNDHDHGGVPPRIRSRRGRQKRPGLGHVYREDLTEDERLDRLYARALRLGFVGGSEHEILMFWALAVHAERVAANPPALFARNLRDGNYRHVAERDVDAANARMKHYAFGMLERERMA